MDSEFVVLGDNGDFFHFVGKRQYEFLKESGNAKYPGRFTEKMVVGTKALIDGCNILAPVILSPDFTEIELNGSTLSVKRKDHVGSQS